MQPDQTQSQQPQDPSQVQQPQTLDPQAVNLAKAIRQTESGGDFNAKGASGEHGAYQFMPATWDAYSKEVGVNVPLGQATPEQQNQVAYTKIKQWKDAGHNVGEIASMWNAGPGKPQAYLEGHTGVNAEGVSYDTPGYAKKVATAYQAIKNGNTQSQSQDQTQPDTTNQPITPNPNDPNTPPPNDPSALEKLINFAFPILGDESKKTGLQKLGDLGLSALWFLPGVGEGAEAAIRGAGLLGETGAKIAGQAIGGATTGYAADVASNLSQGKIGSQAFAPGMGAVTGGTLGGILGKIGSKYGEQGVLNSVSKSNEDIIGQSKRGAAELAESFSKDKDPGALMAEKGINVANTVNPDTVAFETADHAAAMRNDANALTDTLTEALKNVPGSASATDFENSLINKIQSQASDKITAAEQSQIVQDEFMKIRAQYGDTLSAADMNDLKKRAWGLSKFDAAVPNQIRKTQRMIGNNLKTNVETIAEKNGLPEVKGMNEYIGQHLDAADHLDRIHGSKAKGGRLGDTLKSHVGAEVGAGIGAAFGGGIPGALAGALVGHYGGKVIGNIVRDVAASPIKSAILRNMIREDPQIVQKVLAYAKKTPQGLEALQEQLGQHNIPIFKGMAGTNTVAPKAVAGASKKASRLGGLITKTAVKGAVQ